MMTHVDLVQNDLIRGIQSCLGRVASVGDCGVKIEVEDTNLDRLLHAGLIDPLTGRHFTTHDDGDAFLELLARTWQGSYLVATQPHGEETCPFARTRTVPMRQLYRREK